MPRFGSLSVSSPRPTRSQQRTRWSCRQDSVTHTLRRTSDGYHLESQTSHGLVRTPLSMDDEEDVLEILCLSGQRLCFYSSQCVLVGELEYDHRESTADQAVIPGRLVRKLYPLERYFLMNTSASIVRLRAPQLLSHAFLALMKFSDYKYSLISVADSTVSTLLEWTEEELADMDTFVDFCIPTSSKLSLLSSSSAVLLKSSGDLYVASPILPTGTVVPSKDVTEVLEYLTSRLKTLERSSAQWAQCRPAQQYFLDSFPDLNNPLATARNDRESALWRLKLQGPVLFASTEATQTAVTIEAWGEAALAGVVVGRDGGAVDFAIVSPTALLPRFSLEHFDHTLQLDDELFKRGSWVAHVELRDENMAEKTTELTLLPDPLVETLLHYVTPKSVCTISSNAIQVASQKAFGVSSAEEPRTTAWTCLASSSAQTTIQGAVVVGGSTHELQAYLSDGQVSLVNVTEIQYLHEFDKIFASFAPQETNNSSLTVPPSDSKFDETIASYQKKIYAGLSAMVKIVGNTKHTDVGTSTLAVVLQIQDRCNQQVIAPLMELKQVVDDRRKELESKAHSLQEQVASIQKDVAQLKAKDQELGAQLEDIESNGALLLQRSEAVLQASGDLQPSVSTAEQEFFQFTKRMEKKAERWAEDVQEIKKTAESTESGDFEPTEEYTSSVHTILLNESKVLATARDTLRRAQDRLKLLRGRLGMEHSDIENVPSNAAA